MLRSFLTITAVVGLSFSLTQLESAQGQLPKWVRTADGWEPSGVLQIEPRPLAKPALHPLLVATFQLGTSVFALLAFPGGKLRTEGAITNSGRLEPRNRAGKRLNPQLNV